uniref:Gag polyprotein n=1 Tax=Tanacetum cinerariifolium TaxID=118510 RepID=A0A699QB03_TANCI|nr:Gag polyprotein [Tanacetum cinerariifolium]
MKAKTALFLLFQTVDELSFEKIASASTTKEAWDKLEKAYKGDDPVTMCATEKAKDLEELTIEELAGSLEAHEQRNNWKKQESLDEALQTKIKEEKALYAQQNNYSRETILEGVIYMNQVRSRGRDNNHQDRQ